jgi:DNA polymerase III subunit alpha
MYLIYDTETTGLPRDWNAPITNTDNWPRLVQLSWQLHGAKGELLNSGDYIIKPEGFTIPFNAEKVHGISTERGEKEGFNLNDTLDIFERDLARAQAVIGHNVSFDVNIVGAELVRKERKSVLLNLKKIDTKTSSTDFCKIPGGRGGRYKWPTLSELHQKLFGKPFDDAHNSAFDVDATARCFFGLIDKRVIQSLDPEVKPDDITYQAPDLSKASRNMDAASTISTRTTAEVEVATVQPFTHLHVRSQYTILNSTAGIKQVISKAKKLGMTHVAFTDSGNMYGAFKAVAEGEKQGVQVIIGCDVYMVEDRHQKKFTKDVKDKRHQQLLLAKNQEGYKNLSKLCSLGFIEGYYAGYPRVDKELIMRYADNIIALTGGLSGEIPDLILNVGEHQAEDAFRWWKKVFGNDFYVELQRHGLPEEDRVNQILLRFAEKYDVKVVATNNSYYVEKSDATAHDTLICVKDNEYASTPSGRGRGYRFAMPNNEFYFKTPEEMNQLFADIPQAISNIEELVKKTCPLTLKQEILLPKFEIPENFTDQDDFLRHLSYEGAKNRYGEVTLEITERIDHELSIIKNMGFPGYFLIVQDFIRAARDIGVSVGPGRGSAAGSVVAYCIGITNIDPIRYNLLFERFLNPERVSMPDIDIDFDDEGRQRVIDYVVKKYGQSQVAQIITFGTMAPKSAIRDVARVQELPIAESNRVAKLVPDKPGTTFAEAYEQEPELVKLRNGNDKVASILEQAEKMVGSVRNTGIHAAGVIIAPDDISDFIPVKTDKDSDLLVTQFDGSIVENAGMLKMDFLGLKTLSIINTAIGLIKQNHDVNINIDDIPLNDEKTYQLFQRGETIGIFQFESEGMRQWMQKLKPTNIEDLIAMNALYRPGPMQFIPNFINRKHGKEDVSYPHELLEPILKNTYGIMVYQEQIMQTAQILAGYSLGGADLLRRAMGKKKMEEMNKQRVVFINGAKEIHGIEEKQAEDVFNIMEKFAQYGFNRSHSAAYSVLAYQTAYLKANYTAEYMSAVLTHNMDKTDKVTLFMDECRKLGVSVLGPDINESSYNFGVNKEGKVRFGLGAVKGAGEAAITTIIEERNEKGAYPDFFTFAERTLTKSVNKKTLECLAYAGAFDCFPEYHRKQYNFAPDGDHHLIEKAARYAGKRQQELESAQQSLFGGGGGMDIPRPKVVDVAPYSSIEKLRHEKEVLGFYVSGHPLDQFKLEIENFSTCTLDQIDNYKNQEISVAGIVNMAVEKQSRKGNPFGIFGVEDYEAMIELMMFGEKYMENRHLIREGEFLFMRGRVEEKYQSEGQWQFRPTTIQLLSELREKLCKGIRLKLNMYSLNDEMIHHIHQLAETNQGSMALKMSVVDELENIKVEMLSRRYRIQPSNQLFKALDGIDGVKYEVLTS